jgi:phenylpropionate dioxygenase-like ring-hydroxylating dioxygenase large terminal subunit
MNVVTKEDLGEAMTFGVEAYTSEAYARAERDKMWRKLWQHTCRLEEIPNVGDYVTYDILDDSILIVRTAPDKVVAYHNVCQHRGRRLVDTPKGAAHGCGKTKQFVCGFHGWRWDLNGENIYVLDKDDWKGALTDERIRLKQVKVDTWGGWVWINMDLNCEPLLDFIGPVARMLDPFEFEKMRYRWRQWVVFDCNWKTALEAFIESHHVEGTHPQLLKYAEFYTWSQTVGPHSVHGFDTRAAKHDTDVANTLMRPGLGDARISAAELQREVMETVNASTTQTFVDAAARLVHELPEGTPPDKVMAHFLESARKDDAARGVIWPEVPAEHYAKTGIDWHVFPNMSIQHGYTFCLVYRTRPHPSFDPDKCIFEAAVMERYPEGKEPKTEWVHAEPTVEKWRSVLVQDFNNMAAVQKGMKSMGFHGTLPNPKQERPVTNFHRTLAKYMGATAPRPLV